MWPSKGETQELFFRPVSAEDSIRSTCLVASLTTAKRSCICSNEHEKSIFSISPLNKGGVGMAPVNMNSAWQCRLFASWLYPVHEYPSLHHPPTPHHTWRTSSSETRNKLAHAPRPLHSTARGSQASSCNPLYSLYRSLRNTTRECGGSFIARVRVRVRVSVASVGLEMRLLTLAWQFWVSRRA